MATSDNSGNLTNDPQKKDPWVLSQSGYDKSKIYTRASDGNGQSQVIRAKLSPALHYEIMALIQSRAIPELRTVSDVIRDALIHRLHDYREMLPSGAATLFHALDVEVRQAEAEKLTADREAWKKLIETVDKTVTDLIASGELEEAAWTLDRNRDVQSMSPAYIEKLDAVIQKHELALIARGVVTKH